MRAHEYLEMVTAGITDPDRAAQVRKELRAHLDEAIAELTGQAIDAETAEQTAVSRMGAPSVLARELAEVHHRHLPWRHYLSVIPLSCLVAMFFIWSDPSSYWRVGVRWLALLVVCLIPDRPTLGRLLRLIRTDAAAKGAWLKRQALRTAALIGGLAGILGGITWSVVPPLWDGAWARWRDLLQEWNVTHHPHPLVQVGLPLLVAAVVMLSLRRHYSGSWPLLAACAGLAFPLGFLPGYVLWGRHVTDWLTMTLYFQVVYLLCALTLAWVAEVAERRTVSRTTG